MSSYICTAVLISFACATAYFGYRQYLEQKLVAQTVSALTDSRAISWENAIALSQALRQRFNSDKATFNTLNMAGRSFLREDAATLIKASEGLCGEGTRVLVCLLSHLGFDATRVTLFTRWMHPSHTLVSITLDGEEYFIDSLNSQPEFNQFINSEQIGSKDFNVMGHVANVEERRKQKQLLRSATDEMPEQAKKLIFDKYYFYSYDALPWTKLLSALRMQVRLINFKRPHALVSSLAEKPNAIKALLCAFITLLTSACMLSM